MNHKNLDDIEKVDLEALVSDAVPEGRNIEYKEAIPENHDSAKKEFLADITSFANASGGDLIYGIREKRDNQGRPTGLPEAADGIARLEQFMLECSRRIQTNRVHQRP